MIARSPDPATRRLIAQLALGVLLVVAAARWWLIAAVGYEVPYWDQWYSDTSDIEAVSEGSLLHGLFDAHNEHRIVFTRILNRVLLASEHQWNPLSQMLVAALIHALAAAVLTLWLCRNLNRIPARIVAGLVAILYALPHAWQNTLWGFQSQFSFLLLFSFTALWFISEATSARDLRLWIGIAAGVAANLSMSAGIVAGAALSVSAVIGAAIERRIDRGFFIQFLSGSALIAFGFWLKPEVPYHAGLEANDPNQFAAVFVSSLAWPNLRWPALFALGNAPLLWLIVRSLTRQTPWSDSTRKAVTLGAWGALQAAAFAFARGGAAVTSFKAASRYHDLLAVLVAANGIALIQLAMEATQTRSAFRRTFAAFLAIWCATCAIGLINLTRTAVRAEILPRAADPYLHTRLLTAIQDGAGPQVYSEFPATFATWYPYEKVSEILRDPYFATWLPPGLQNPIPLEWPTGAGMQNLLHQTFLIPNVVPRGFYPTWTSRNGAASNQTGLAQSTPIRLQGRSWVMAFAYGGDPASIHISVRSQAPQTTLNLNVSSYPTETWEEWMIAGIDGKSVLEASVTDSNSWVAFSSFRFAGSGYALVNWLRKNTMAIWVVLATGAVLLIASPFVANRKGRPHSAREMTPSSLTRSNSRISGA